MLRCVVVLGATATGKTELGIRIAEALGGEIINADALQVYRGFNIGTAKPSASEQARARHHLIDVLAPEEPFSAGQFADLAWPLIGEIEGRGALPIVVGGSGLYLRALLDGISPLPRTDPATRAALTVELESEGLGALYRQLESVDPVTAKRLAPGDSHRVQRALEVWRSSGRTLSSWIAEQPFGHARLGALRIGLTLPRTILYDRIADRVWKMVDRGWVEEVKALMERVGPDVPAFQAIGYRQIASFVRGEIDFETAIEATIRATRRYAKRQETWFRRRDEVVWFPVSDLPVRFPWLLSHLRTRRRKWLNE